MATEIEYKAGPPAQTLEQQLVYHVLRGNETKAMLLRSTIHSIALINIQNAKDLKKFKEDQK